MAIDPSFRPCALIPTFDNPDTIRAVVVEVGRYLPVITIDDGSGARARAELDALVAEGLTLCLRHPLNRGKGAAMSTGFTHAVTQGYTHALQVDADGQHALADIPRLLASGAARPEALILGAPIYDESAPRSRLIGRQISRFWTHIETHGRVIEDPMCGFRLYPLPISSEVARRSGARMDFDNDIAVRLAWTGIPVVNLPTRVHYPPGGVSHFDLWGDNLRISWMHTRLVIGSFSAQNRRRRLARAAR